MRLAMMKAAQPYDIERLAVIRMVSFDFCFATYPTWVPFHYPFCNSSLANGVRYHSFGISLPVTEIQSSIQCFLLRPLLFDFLRS